MRKLRLPSPALVIACLALAISLSGVGYAAIKLPAGSVGTKQLKANAVTGAKVKNNTLSGADVNEASLQGVVHTGDAAGGDLVGTFPNPTIADGAIGANEVAEDSLGGADIDEASLNVIQGLGVSSAGSTVLTVGGQMSPVTIVGVSGAGVIQAQCLPASAGVTWRFQDFTGSLTYAWLDTGVDDPVDMRAAGSGVSANTPTTASTRDLVTWFIHPTTSTARTLVHVAVLIEGGQCTFDATLQRIGG